MDDVSQKLSLPKRQLKYVDRIIWQNDGYKVYLKKGYNNGNGGNTFFAISQRELKKVLDEVKVGLTDGEIKEQAKLGSWGDQLDEFLREGRDDANTIIENLDQRLKCIDASSKKNWDQHLKEKAEAYKATGKPLSAFEGFINYEDYKLSYRAEKGIKPLHMALYAMRSKQRLEAIGKYLEVTKIKLRESIESEVGKLKGVDYVFRPTDGVLIGQASGEKGKVIFKIKRGNNLKSVEQGFQIEVYEVR